MESPWSTYHGKHVPVALWYSELVPTGVDDIDVGDIFLYGTDPGGPVAGIETVTWFLCLKAPFN